MFLPTEKNHGSSREVLDSVVTHLREEALAAAAVSLRAPGGDDDTRWARLGLAARRRVMLLSFSRGGCCKKLIDGCTIRVSVQIQHSSSNPTAETA